MGWKLLVSEKWRRFCIFYRVGAAAIFDVIPMCGCHGAMELFLRYVGSKGKHDASTPSVLGPAVGRSRRLRGPMEEYKCSKGRLHPLRNDILKGLSRICELSSVEKELRAPGQESAGPSFFVTLP